jgi:hypothetical protein
VRYNAESKSVSEVQQLCPKIRTPFIVSLVAAAALFGVSAYQTGSSGAASTTTTTEPSGGTCTNPTWHSSRTQQSENTDGGAESWWVNNDAWSGSHGPQKIYACSAASWYAVSNQPNNQGQVETYPDTEYDVGGRESLNTKPLSHFTRIKSKFSEAFPTAGGWDAAYDLWLNNYSQEIMIWNQWAGANGYGATLAKEGGIQANIHGVPYWFYKNGGELMFFRKTQVASGSVDILAALNWLVSNPKYDGRLVKASSVPTQLEYGVEVSYTHTDGGNETFPMNGVTFEVRSN